MTAFTDPLPLRTTAAWAGFRAVRVIPHRYGETAGELIQYDQARQLFVWSDHAVQAIDSVTVDDQNATGWRWYNGADSTGKPVGFVEFSQPVDAGATPRAAGRGKLHRTTGRLITNPALVLADVLITIAGMPYADADLDDFRAECERLGIVAAGSISEAGTVQTTLAGICAGVGAAFGVTAPGLARVFPGGALDSYVAATIAPPIEVNTVCALESLATELAIDYAYADGQPTASITIDAPDAVATYGRRPLRIGARWVGNVRVAYQLAERILQWRARPRWTLSATSIRARIKPGQTIAVAHPHAPFAGQAIVQSATYDAPTERSAVDATYAVGALPRVRLIQNSAQHAADQYAGATIQTQGSERVITITDQAGKPLANAKVVLDGTTTRYSDAGGRVSFPVDLMPRGPHRLDITAGDVTLTVDVIVP